MIISGVADTHAAVWYLLNDPRISRAAANFISAASLAQWKIAVSSISLAELVYLVEKKRLPMSIYDDVARALADTSHVFVEAPLDALIVTAMWQVSRVEVPDMPDRIIAATGIHLGVPVISRDRRIRAASLSTIW